MIPVLPFEDGDDPFVTLDVMAEICVPLGVPFLGVLTRYRDPLEAMTYWAQHPSQAQVRAAWAEPAASTAMPACAGLLRVAPMGRAWRG